MGELLEAAFVVGIAINSFVLGYSLSNLRLKNTLLPILSGVAVVLIGVAMVLVH